MSKAIRSACAKLLTVETAAGILMQTPQASPLLPSLMWLREEVSDAMVTLCKTTKRPVKEAEKVDKIIDQVKKVRDESPNVKPHGEIYLAFAITLILDDLLMQYNDPVKKAMIGPLHECAMNIEAGLDNSCDLYETHKEADDYLARVYAVIDEVNGH